MHTLQSIYRNKKYLTIIITKLNSLIYNLRILLNLLRLALSFLWWNSVLPIMYLTSRKKCKWYSIHLWYQVKKKTVYQEMCTLYICYQLIRYLKIILKTKFWDKNRIRGGWYLRVKHLFVSYCIGTTRCLGGT